MKAHRKKNPHISSSAGVHAIHISNRRELLFPLDKNTNIHLVAACAHFLSDCHITWNQLFTPNASAIMFFCFSFLHLSDWSHFCWVCHRETRTNIISTSPEAVSRKLYSILRCAGKFLVAWPTKNKERHIFFGPTHSPVTTSSATCHFRWEIFLFPVRGVEAKNGSASCQMCLWSCPELQWELPVRTHQPIPSGASKMDYEFFEGTCLLFGWRLKAVPCKLSLTAAAAMMMLLNFSHFRCCQAAAMHHVIYATNATCTHTHTHISCCALVAWKNAASNAPSVLQKCLLFDKGAIYLMIILCLFSNAYAVVGSLALAHCFLLRLRPMRIRLYRITKMVSFIFTENRLISFSSPVYAIYFIIDMLFVFGSHSVCTRLDRYTHFTWMWEWCTPQTADVRFKVFRVPSKGPGPTEIEWN